MAVLLLHREVEKNDKTPDVLVLMKVLYYHIFVLTCGQQELYKVFQREKKEEEEKKSQEREPSAEKMTRQKEQGEYGAKQGGRKGESNDSPEIPDRRVTSDIPGLPSGACTGLQTEKSKQAHDLKIESIFHHRMLGQ